MRTHIYIGIVLMLFILGNTGYTQDQGKDDSLDAAINSFLQAVEKNPHHADAHYNLGILYSEKGMREEAVAEYKKTLELEPNYVKAHNNLGVIYYETDRFDEAIECFKKLSPPLRSILRHNII